MRDDEHEVVASDYKVSPRSLEEPKKNSVSSLVFELGT
jgi:hypothetical protein